jgi:hypothetical protein
LVQDERMTSRKRRRQMLQLEEEAYHARTAFNRHFSALRDRKVQLVADIISRNERLQAINTALGISGEGVAQHGASLTC